MEPHPSPNLPFLPDDIVQCIFTAVFTGFESDLLDASLARGHSNPWNHFLKTKKSVTLVSRQWYICAVSFLYSDIVIRRPSALLALAETLASKPGYGALVLSLCFDGYVLLEMADGPSSRHIDSMINSCPNLVALKLSEEVQTNLSLTRCSHPALKKLSLVDKSPADTFPAQTLFRILGSNLHIVTLSLTISTCGQEQFNPISLPALQGLYLRLDPNLGAENVVTSLKGWELPSLTKLALWMGSCDYPSPTLRDACWRVVEAHGSRLEYLDLSRLVSPPQQSLTRSVTDMCPRLQQLILTDIAVLEWPYFDSDALHVDIWLHSKVDDTPFDSYPSWNPSRFHDWLANRAGTALASKASVCGSVRFISYGLYTYPALPLLLPPIKLAEDVVRELSIAAPRLHDIYGLRITEWKEGVMLEDEYMGHWPGQIGPDMSLWYEPDDTEMVDMWPGSSDDDSDWDNESCHSDDFAL